MSYLLWATQGQKNGNSERGWALRVVPSAGARHCLETYVYIDKVEGITKGLYRYLPIEDQIIESDMTDDIKERLNQAMSGQLYNAAVVFIWTATPYKMEYKYTTVAHKMIAIEVGHVCQNLYLASESIECGCCAISGYLQKEMDAVVNIDGEEEFVIYMGVVGKY